MNIQSTDPSKGHFYVSLAKSALRIGAGWCLFYLDFKGAGGLLIAAEALGILEELV